MPMTPGLRKLALTTHITSSVGWLGAVGAFLALAIAGLGSQDPQIVRAAYLAMHLTTRFVIVPLSLAALLTGVVESLGTTWDLGYAIGALLAGITADAFGLSGTMWLVAGLTLISGVVAAVRMDETARLSAA